MSSVQLSDTSRLSGMLGMDELEDLVRREGDIRIDEEEMRGIRPVEHMRDKVGPRAGDERVAAEHQPLEIDLAIGAGFLESHQAVGVGRRDEPAIAGRADDEEGALRHGRSLCPTWFIFD